MTLTRIIRTNGLALLMLALASVFTACSSAPERPDEPAMKADDPLDMDAPSPEKLADSPCGNPDWSKLPSSMPKKETGD